MRRRIETVLQGWHVSNSPVKPHPLEAFASLARTPDLPMRPGEAAAALSGLARLLQNMNDPVLRERAMALGRLLSSPEVVDTLLAAAEQPWADTTALAGALRFRGSSVVGAILGRLNAAQDREARRPWFQIAVALASFEELRDSLVGSLEAALADRRGEVVRNAISLMAAIGAPLPRECHFDLATSEDVRVRLAFAQVASRWKPSGHTMELLCRLVEDEHPSVRLAAALGLRAYPHERARSALARRAVVERDPETRAVCTGALKQTA